MALSKHPQTLVAMAAAFTELADLLRYIRDSSGDLQVRVLFDTVDRISRAESAYRAARVDMQTAGAAADKFLADLGGPSNLATLNSRIQTIGAARTNYLNALEAYIKGKSGAELVEVFDRTDADGNTSRVMQYCRDVPQQEADVIRSAPQLNNLILALEAAGA